MQPYLKEESTLQGGKYRIDKVLGQGGFGITYLAVHTLLDKQVAIKEFFPKSYCDRDESTSRVTLTTRNNEELVSKLKAKFLKEARNISKLNHPGIVKIYDIFEEHDTAYYVMEYIEGGSLSEMVKRSGVLPEAKAISYVLKVGAALEYIHFRKMNHLDVKPANIMVRREDDAPILIDFGLAKQYDASGGQTSTTPVGISLGYAPMEQYRQNGVSTFTPQTDVYSLGATLYTLVTGTTPPEAAELIDSPLAIPNGVSGGVSAVIRKAMSVGKAGRYATVAEFCRALGEGDTDEDTVMDWKNERDGIVEMEERETVNGIDICWAADVTREQKGILRRLVGNMIYVSGGTFSMGSDSIEAYDWEKPVHTETVEDFWINKYAVTQKEWRAVTGNNPSYFKGDDLPVENINYDHCRQFLQRLNAMTGLSFRLPTEEEWEFAAKGGNKSGNYKYSGSNRIEEVAWYGADSTNRSHAVGMKLANELGLYDMSGNVWEWTASRWRDDYKASPSDYGRVYRGGGWSSNENRCRLSFRGYNSPVNCYNALGLRLVM